MERMKNTLATALLSMLVMMNPASAALDGFKAAEPRKEVTPSYPIDRFADGSETSLDDGLLEIRFVVTEGGNIVSPMVVRTSMAKYVEPTLRALESTSYAPATVNGKPVASAVTQTFMFQVNAADLRNSRGASASFANIRDNGVPDGFQSFYDQFTKELERREPSQEKAEGLLKRMVELKHQSFYSLAYHSLARYRLAEKFQGSEEKIRALQDLIWFDPLVKEKFQILKGDLRDAIWTSLLKEQIQAGQYAEALNTHAEFTNLRAGSDMPFADAIAQITELKGNEQVVQRSISISESGFTHLPLLKNSFTFIDVNGSISNLILRCEARFTELKYQADAQYELPESWGACDLQVVGSAGTTSKILSQ